MSNSFSTTSGKSLVIKDDNHFEHIIEFDWPIAQVLEIGAMALVRTESDPGKCNNENVFGISTGGAIAWRIGPRKHVYDDSPYTGMVRAQDKVRLINWDGLELLVEPTTGEVLETKHGRC